jgi:hypothetical protein
MAFGFKPLYKTCFELVKNLHLHYENGDTLSLSKKTGLLILIDVFLSQIPPPPPPPPGNQNDNLNVTITLSKYYAVSKGSHSINSLKNSVQVGARQVGKSPNSTFYYSKCQ